MGTEEKSETEITINDFWQDIEAFHRKYGFDRAEQPTFLPRPLQEVRINFLLEELMETASACQVDELQMRQPSPFEYPRLRLIARNDEPMSKWHMEKALDGLVDLVYVALGTAWLMGLDFPEAWRRVHAANMQKVRAQRKEESARGTTFDVVKPAGWQPPSLSDLVRCPICNDDGYYWLPGRPAHASNRVDCICKERGDG